MLMGLHSSAAGPTEPVTLYSPQQLADMLGVGLDWVRRRTQNRTLPHVKVGRKVWFTEAHIGTIVRQLTVEPVGREQARRGSARSLL
jgi:excisionase family DNA binding protein